MPLLGLTPKKLLITKRKWWFLMLIALSVHAKGVAGCLDTGFVQKASQYLIFGNRALFDPSGQRIGRCTALRRGRTRWLGRMSH